jgi:hypothetical protein
MPPPKPIHYAPALSRAAFAKARPQGRKTWNYQNYLQYLKANRPQWDIGHPMRRQLAPPKGAAPSPHGPVASPFSIYQQFGMESPAQIQKRANQMVQQQMMAQRQLISGDWGDAQKEAMARMLAFQSAGRAAAAMNAQLMGMVGSGYTGAGSELNAYGSAIGKAASGATAADVAAANATLANVGAGAVTEGGPVGAPGVAGPSQAAVELFRGATLPAEALGTAGTAAQVGLGGLVGAQNLRATQEAQAAYMQALGEASKQRTQEMRQLISQRPQVYASLYNQLQNANMNMARLYQQAQYQNAQIANARSELRQRYLVARQQAVTAAQKMAVDKWYKQQSLSLDRQGMAIRSFTAQSGRISAQASASRAQTAAAKAAASGETGNYYPPGYKGKGPIPMQGIVANVLADVTKHYANLRYDPESAFAWSWPRVRSYFPKGMQSQAAKYLRKRLKALKPKSGGGFVPFDPSLLTPEG